MPTPRSRSPPGGVELIVIGAAMLVSEDLIAGTSVYRYFFSGHLSGDLVITFIEGSWQSTDGIAVRRRHPHRRRHRPNPSLTWATIGPRTWVGVRLTPTAGAQVNVATLGAERPHLLGRRHASALVRLGAQYADGLARYSVHPRRRHSAPAPSR